MSVFCLLFRWQYRYRMCQTRKNRRYTAILYCTACNILNISCLCLNAARLESVYSPKGNRGFESPSFRFSATKKE